MKLKKLLSGILTTALLMGSIQLPVFADSAKDFSVVFNGVEKSYSTMAEVAADMRAGDSVTIKLTDSMVHFEGDQVRLTGGDLTLDLNGQTLLIDEPITDPETECLMPSFYITGENSRFTITDSSEGEKGKIKEQIDLAPEESYMYTHYVVADGHDKSTIIHDAGTIDCSAALRAYESSVYESATIKARRMGIYASGSFKGENGEPTVSSNAVISNANITVMRDKLYNDTSIVDVNGYTNTLIEDSKLYFGNEAKEEKLAWAQYGIRASGVFGVEGKEDTRNTKFEMYRTDVTVVSTGVLPAYAVYNYNNAPINIIEDCKFTAQTDSSNTIGFQFNPSVHGQYKISGTEIRTITKNGWFIGIDGNEDYNIDDANVEFNDVKVVCKLTGTCDTVSSGRGISGIGHYKDCDVTVSVTSRDACGYYASATGIMSEYADALLEKTSLENVSIKVINTDKADKYGNKGAAYGALIYGIENVKDDVLIKNGTSFYAKGNGEAKAVCYKEWSYDSEWTGKERTILDKDCYWVDSKDNKISDPSEHRYVLVTDGSKKAEEPDITDDTDPTGEEYTIEYVLRDTEEDPAVNSTKNKLTYTGKSKVRLYAPVRTGYTFAGWYEKDPDDPDFNARTDKKVSYIKKGSEGNKTLYAGWKENRYKLSYNANKGKFVERMTKIPHNYSDEYDTVSGNVLKERKGYTFIGWNTKKRGGEETRIEALQTVSRLTAKNKKTVTLYAEWSVNEYPVHYVLNGGVQAEKNGVQINPETHTYIKAVRLAAPTREGYKFAGWYRAYDEETGEFGQKVKSIPKKTEEITLYAKWIEQ